VKFAGRKVLLVGLTVVVVVAFPGAAVEALVGRAGVVKFPGRTVLLVGLVGLTVVVVVAFPGAAVVALAGVAVEALVGLLVGIDAGS